MLLGWLVSSCDTLKGVEDPLAFPDPIDFPTTGDTPGRSSVRVRLPELTPEQQVLYPTYVVEWRLPGQPWQSREVDSLQQSFVTLSLADGQYELRVRAVGDNPSQVLISPPLVLPVQGIGKFMEFYSVQFVNISSLE